MSKRQELIASLDHSRDQITHDASQLGDALNVSRKLEASFHAYRYWWIGGGILAGLLVAKNLFGPFRGRKQDEIEKKSPSKGSSTLLSLIGVAGKQIIRLSRPMLLKALEKEIHQWVTQLSKKQLDDHND
ncbi:MAG: hypothetical protein L3J39_14945 [Verrucomicrobiales bacterium]|nr:hypothetical protein [Verrucomicrobiales bacterium]